MYRTRLLGWVALDQPQTKKRSMHKLWDYWTHILPQVNNPFERHQFCQAKQKESETADQFVTRLFQLSENCDFGTSKEEKKSDQLIDKCRSHDPSQETTRC